MMAYDSQLVLAIMHNGSPVREINGKVTLPFNSEYKIRLKNKHGHLRTKARVWVDGRKASSLGDFIIQPGKTLDLERFLDESMNSGRCFKFVPLSDGRVNDPTDPANGIIKVQFYREIDFFNSEFKIDISPAPKPWKPNSPFTWDNGTAGPYSGGSGSTTYRATSSFTYDSSLVSNSVSCNYVSSPGQAGATVEGGHSGQQFVEGLDFQTEVFPVTLSLRIQGPREQRPVVSPRPRKPSKVRFCSDCGAKRLRTSRFCHRCGAEYPRVMRKR